MANDQHEWEIKFSGAMPDLALLPESPLLRALAPGGGHWQRLVSTYYDTPDSALHRHGLSLRRRAGADGLIQTVKSVTAPGTLLRGEWECQISTAEDFPLFTGDEEIDRLLMDAAPRLKEISAVSVDRWQSEFVYKTSLLEVSVDLGFASALNHDGVRIEGPLGEAELQLIKGDPADLFLGARLLLESTPLRLHARSKLETAKRIANRESLAVPKFDPIPSTLEDSAGDILQRALETAAARVIDLQAPILHARLPEGIHRMRVELRRFRAAEKLFRQAAASPPLRRQAEKAAVIARALAPARDWDVFLEQTLPGLSGHDYAITGFAQLVTSAQARRAEAWAAASTQIGKSAFSGFALDLLAAAYLKPWRAARLDLPAKAFATQALDRALRKAAKSARMTDPDRPETFHPLRLSLKKLRYGVQLFRDLYPKGARKPYMAAMAALQDKLGVLSDAVAAQHMANEAAKGAGEDAMSAAGFICGFYAARAEAAAKEIDASWRVFEKKSPFWRQ